MKQEQKLRYRYLKILLKNAIKKEEARPFKVADNILMMVIDPLTWKKS